MPTLPKVNRPHWLGPPRKAWEHRNRWEGYNTRRWRDASKQFKILHPVCSTPGCNRATYVTDHKVPIAAGCDPWDQRNWQPLCYKCNKGKTAQDGHAARRAERPDKGNGKKI